MKLRDIVGDHTELIRRKIKGQVKYFGLLHYALSLSNRSIICLLRDCYKFWTLKHPHGVKIRDGQSRNVGERVVLEANFASSNSSCVLHNEYHLKRKASKETFWVSRYLVLLFGCSGRLWDYGNGGYELWIYHVSNAGQDSEVGLLRECWQTVAPFEDYSNNTNDYEKFCFLQCCSVPVVGTQLSPSFPQCHFDL